MEKVPGFVDAYGLQDWWFSTFTLAERTSLKKRIRPIDSPPSKLTSGIGGSLNITATTYLHALLGLFRSKKDSTFATRFYRKIQQIGKENPITGAGYYIGRHFGTYVWEVEKLKKKGNVIELEVLLIELIKATEAESVENRKGVFPWYYGELAIIYHKQKEYQKEVEIYERFASQKHYSEALSGQFQKQLIKARKLLAK